MGWLVALALVPVGALLPTATFARDDATQLRLNDLDERLARIERIIGNDSLLLLSQRLDALEAQQREQRGSLEELQHGSAQLTKQQRDLYADLEARIARLEAGLRAAATNGDAGVAGGAGAAGNAGTSGSAGAGANGAAATGAAASAEGGEQAAYDRAFAALKAADYAGAAGQFEAFMKKYPGSALLDNAEYWLGEAHYVSRDYAAAAAAFAAVGERWPDSRKAPDALLKLGYSQYELKQVAEARATLAAVSARFPGSNAARLAEERLKRLGAAH